MCYFKNGILFQVKITYIKSATVLLESNGVKILTDPWLVDGEYYGSWYHYPKLELKKEFFENIDFIYLSHIHPDHFSRKTFQLLNKNIPVLIHRYESKFLKDNLERLGFKAIELEHNKRTHLKNGVHINILAADNCNPELCAKLLGCGIVETKFGSTQIDSLCVIDNGEFTLVNTNDCLYSLAKDCINIIKKTNPKIDLLLVGYAGAGPYPQCFKMPENKKTEEADKKIKQFLDHGLKYIHELNPEFVLPFAGTYVLGGKLSALNKYRGVPEIEHAADYFANNASSKVILMNSYENFDLKNKTFSKPYEKTDFAKKENYIHNILPEKLMDYEHEKKPSIEELIPLLEKAYLRFELKRKEISYGTETKVLIRLDEQHWYSISGDGSGIGLIDNEKKEKIKKFISYELDIRLLKNLLLGPRYAHWNNAEVGSHVQYERVPNVYERGLYHSMCFFHS